MTSLEYQKGFRAALRYLVIKAGYVQQDKGLNRFAKILAKNTLDWLKICHDNAGTLADGGDIELWLTPEGKLLQKKEQR